jgi:hypothetical protein
MRIASTMLTELTLPVPAMSNAVPWSTDVRRIGIPAVIEIVRSKSSVFVAMCPWVVVQAENAVYNGRAAPVRYGICSDRSFDFVSLLFKFFYSRRNLFDFFVAE